MLWKPVVIIFNNIYIYVCTYVSNTISYISFLFESMIQIRKLRVNVFVIVKELSWFRRVTVTGVAVLLIFFIFGEYEPIIG